MSRLEKLKLFGKAILQDFIDTNNDIEVYKSALSLMKTNNVSSSLCTYLNECDETNKVDEKWIDTYSEEDFYFHFHMSKVTFNILLQDILSDENLCEIYYSRHRSVPMDNSLLITVWFLAKGGGVREISEQFHLSLLSALHIVDDVIKILFNMRSKYLIWPNERESEQNADAFFSDFHYPGISGVIGNIHIKIQAPKNKEEAYRNKQMGHSVILQGICNSENEFLNIFAGFPGSLDCASILKYSPFYKNLEETTPSRFFYNKYHLSGSENYPLRSWLMVPYRNNQVFNIMHIKHNRALQKSLISIKRTFAILKGRWKILENIGVNSVKKITRIIEACCVLHNFCIKYNDLFDDVFTDEQNESLAQGYLDVTEQGEGKRNYNLKMFA